VHLACVLHPCAYVHLAYASYSLTPAREGRQNGIHFTPTVLLNGLEDGSVSSSFGKEDWDKYLS
jgi:hypothetical protein